MNKLLNLLPVVAIVGVGFIAWQRYQGSQAASRPDYESSTAADPSRPTGQAPQTTRHQVKRVTDGDTIVLDNGDKIRFCGIDAPETQHGNKPGQPLGEESKANLQKLIDAAGGTVLVMGNERDRYDRIVAEIFTKVAGSEEEKYLNGEQVRSGLAYDYKQYSKSCLNHDVIETSEERAKAEKKGVWSGSYQKPWDFRKVQRER